MLWEWFLSKDVKKIKIINVIMNSKEYCCILDGSLLKSANVLHMKNFVFQQDNNPKQTHTLITKYLNIKKNKKTGWSQQLPNIKSTQNLLLYLKIKIAQKKTENIKELGEITIE